MMSLDNITFQLFSSARFGFRKALKVVFSKLWNPEKNIKFSQSLSA